MGFGFPTAPLQASAINFTPTTPSDWSPEPTEVGGALDQLASRVTVLESVPGATAQEYSCPSGAAVRQAVYLSGSNAVALADASDVTKMPAIGFIASKPTSTSCILQDEDELDGFVGLTPGARYFFDPTTPGGIRTTPPSAAGHVEQQAGFAKSTTVLKIELGVSPEMKL